MVSGYMTEESKDPEVYLRPKFWRTAVAVVNVS